MNPCQQYPDSRSNTSLSVRGVSLGYGGDPVVHNVDLDIEPGSFTSIIGPNGCGKSTLLKGLARLLDPVDGQVLLDGRPLKAWKPKAVARQVGLLPQASSAPEGSTVYGIVRRGRFPHQGFLSPWGEDDEAAVIAAMERTGTTALCEAQVGELSGGQRQRVWVAMALAQETGILLLDEPTTFLDIGYQLELLDLFAELNREGRTIIAVLHDLNLAARYSTRIAAMADGQVVTYGTPQEVITETTIQQIYGVTSSVIPDPHTAAPMVVPISGGQR